MVKMKDNAFGHTIGKKMEVAEEAFHFRIDAIAEEIRGKVVIPFCDLHNLQFTAGNGHFKFSLNGESIASGDEYGSTFYPGPLSPRIPGLMDLICLLVEPVPFHEYGIGSCIKNYTPRDARPDAVFGPVNILIVVDPEEV